MRYKPGDDQVQLRDQPKEARMSVLVTMRVKVHDFEGTKQAVEKYGDAMLKAGAHRFKVYQRDGDDKEVLWLMEFDSHEAFEKSGSDFEEDFVSLINPASDWDDAVWKLSLQSE
jgi:hypothetical protein